MVCRERYGTTSHRLAEAYAFSAAECELFCSLNYQYHDMFIADEKCHLQNLILYVFENVKGFGGTKDHVTKLYSIRRMRSRIGHNRQTSSGCTFVWPATPCIIFYRKQSKSGVRRESSSLVANGSDLDSIEQCHN